MDERVFADREVAAPCLTSSSGFSWASMRSCVVSSVLLPMGKIDTSSIPTGNSCGVVDRAPLNEVGVVEEPENWGR